MRRALAGLVGARLSGDLAFAARDPLVREVLEGGGRRLTDSATDHDTAPDAVLLLSGELGAAGDRAERLLAETADGVRAGGWLAVSIDNGVRAGLGTGDAKRRSWRPDEVAHLLGGRGLRVEELWAPGAAAELAGRDFAVDTFWDREPSLLGVGPVLLAIARAPMDLDERSEVFFATLPCKTIAAATILRDPDGRILVVHDSFKRRWTIPGGVVDADEDPRTAAVRETREETGLDVRITGLLGVFHDLHPDRLVFVFGARPEADGQDPRPVHTHEIDGVRWVPVQQALREVAPHTARQIRLGLEQPGGVW